MLCYLIQNERGSKILLFSVDSTIFATIVITRVIMKSILYHGSSNIIEVPQIGKGNPNNDYGLGFYCTENLELAKEWASSSATDGFANEYALNWKGLTVCDLSKGHNILNWMAILVENRTFDLTNAVAESAREYLLENFLPKYKEADIVRGYRADDSYFTFAKDFLNNSIPLETLSEAMRLGKLGEQIVLRSQKAFDALLFKQAHRTDSSIYYPKKASRDSRAREEYQEIRRKFDPAKATFMIDIIRNKWTNDDERLQ